MFPNTPADVTFAVRMMKRKPGFTAAVIVTLAIGIGATTAMFGTIHAALLSSLPFDEPDRLVMGRATFDGQINPWVSGYDYYDYRDQSESFEHLSAFMYGGRVTVLSGAEPATVDSAFCTCEHCCADTLAMALNRYPSKYGVELEGSLKFPARERASIRRELGLIMNHAAEVVAERPRHTPQGNL